MAELHLQGEEKDAATRTLDWDKTNAQALFSEGVRVATTDPAQAITYLAAAVRGNPTDGPTYAAIARLKEQGGELAEAEQAMQAAAQMAPRRVDVQLEAARFWFRRGDIARAMKHMDVVLTFGGSLREQIFPDLLKLAEDPATREIAHAKLLKQRITWWPQFFNHAAAKATSVETLRALFQMQADGPNAVTTEGLRAYLQRLQRENLWIESYLVWLNNLRKDQLNAIGNLFNGGFEEEISNLGFDWIVTPASQVVVDTASTYGATGHKALRVVFRGPRIQFQHVHQYLMLDPGHLFPAWPGAAGQSRDIRGHPMVHLLRWQRKGHRPQRALYRNRPLATLHCPVPGSGPGLHRADASPRTGRPVRARLRSQGSHLVRRPLDRPPEDRLIPPLTS